MGIRNRYALPFEPSDPASPYLGTYDDVAYYLLYDDVLGGCERASPNILNYETLQMLDGLHKHEGKRIVIGEALRLGAYKMQLLNIEFKQIPYDIYDNHVITRVLKAI